MLVHMRTTIRIEDDLFRQVRQLAVRTGRTLTSTIQDALRQSIAVSRRSNRKAPLKLTTFGGGGLRPGVDLDDTASLEDRMNGRRGPR
jgi:post-segregation antitoxin (ccd killing protein)